MARKDKSAPTPALRQLHRFGVPFEIRSYEHLASHGFGDEAVANLGEDAARVFKTLLLVTDSEEYLVALVPVASQLSLKDLARAAGCKSVQLVPAAVAERRTGYVVGGISPFGQQRSHRTFLDDSAQQFPRIIVSAGKRGLSVEVAPAVLEEVLDAQVAPIRSGP